MQHVRLMMFSLNIIEYSMSFLSLSTCDFFAGTILCYPECHPECHHVSGDSLTRRRNVLQSLIQEPRHMSFLTDNILSLARDRGYKFEDINTKDNNKMLYNAPRMNLEVGRRDGTLPLGALHRPTGF